MLKNFNWAELKSTIGSRGATFWIRASIAALLLANLVTAYFVFYPFGGTSEEMDQKRQALVTQLRSNKLSFDRSKMIGAKVEKGQSDQPVGNIDAAGAGEFIANSLQRHDAIDKMFLDRLLFHISV